MNVQMLVIIGFFFLLMFGVSRLKVLKIPFNQRVALGLVVGILYGLGVQHFFGSDAELIKGITPYIGALGSVYIRLLRMIVIPLIFISILSAIIKQKDKQKNFLKSFARIISILLITTAISATIGIFVSKAFDLNASEFPMGENEQMASEKLETRLEDFSQTSFLEKFIEVIPTNPFAALTGEGPNATLSVVLFSTLLGFAALKAYKRHPESVSSFQTGVVALQDVIMSLVSMILRLTPYGVMAQMAKMMLQSSLSQILLLGEFVIASYIALILMFLVHLIFLKGFGISPLDYLKKSMPVLTFAFASRSSAATLPLNVKTLTESFEVDEASANLSASLGTNIGQNGCAGIYPAMLAMMIAPVVGIDSGNIGFILSVILITTLSSFGIAGVGGGATFAALTVLSALGLPVALVGVLIAIEPLIDMGRTALNVSGSMVAGLIENKFLSKNH